MECMDLRTCTPQQWIENEETLLKHLENRTLSEIPLLNVCNPSNLKEHSVVRFRGMIQDMHSPEYYLEKYEVVNQKTDTRTSRCGKYIDVILTDEEEYIDDESSATVTSERQTYVVVSIPAVNAWVKDIEHKQHNTETCNDMKQGNESGHVATAMDVDVSEPSSTSDFPNKKFCTATSRNNSSSQQKDTNMVNKDESSNMCHVKVYKDTEELKLNDMLEFVGFLSFTQPVEGESQEKIPTIHCIKYQALKHNNPLICDSPGVDCSFDHLYKELRILFTQLLLGDELAAEYLILHLVSEVYSRQDFLSLGKFSLNIFNIPEIKDMDYVSEVYKFIELLIPKSYYLPMTLDNMNTISMIPKKDYSCDKLMTGILQLSKNTHIILDETKLTPGRLNSAGIDNVKAFGNIIKYQKITYDFNYYPLEFDCDIPFLIFSEGKSLINCDSQIALKPDSVSINTFSEILIAAKHFLNPELLNNIRKYLTLARMSKYEIASGAETLVQEEFVNMRQRGAATVDDLHNLLVVARLVCLTQGKASLDEECWKKACSLEDERKKRISK